MRPKCCPLLIQTLLCCLCVPVVLCQETRVRPGTDAPSAAKMQRSILNQPGLVKSEFIFEAAPFPECHASTIVESESGLIAAWFGGTRERHPDVGIWVSRFVDGKWSAPVEFANGIQSPTNRFPCWNPVLFQPKT